MIMSPLGAFLMPALRITPAQFGLAVSCYAFSAGISGFLAAGFADRFDRKSLLIFFYVGFLIATFLCGIAWTYPFLIFARTLTGIFGGVIGSIVLAIVADLFPFQMRGRVMGYVQTAFAASQILGLPLGLFLANHWGWHAPFMMIAAVSAMVGMLILKFLQPINSHLQNKIDQNAVHHLIATATNRQYLVAFAATALLTTGGFMLMPFSSAFTVHNMEISLEHLPFVYFATGVSAIFFGPLIGKISDSFGQYKTFVAGTILTIFMVVIYTNLGSTPLIVVMIVNIVLFSGIFSRMIPAQALNSAVPSTDQRGAFMAVSSSLQQVSGGFASIIAGTVVKEEPGGRLLHFDILGYIMVGIALTTAALMYFVDKNVKNNKGPQ